MIVPSLCGKVSTRGSRVSSIGNAGPSRRIPTIASSARFVDAQLRGIVGIELHVARVYGKAKLNQNCSPADRSGVIRGLEKGSLSERETAAAMVAAGLDNG
jgi:predicted FMN-binding regulatory protein PaiB